MKKFWKKIPVAALAVFLVIGFWGNTQTHADELAWPAGPQIESPNAIVMEASTGTVLYEKNADEQRYPASITKIMTTMLALENCPLDEVITFSKDAVYKNEGDTSHIARDVGEEMTLEQCLYAVMLESANECAYAVAEHVGGGTCTAFVDMMNAKAEELGCTDTHFNNPNGLPDETHVTTCRDMAVIAREAIKNDAFRTIAGTVRYTIPPTNKHTDETRLNNHHRMISPYKGSGYLYEYAIGGKTGYTVAAGSTLVTYAEKDGVLLICVIMNSNGTHYDDTRTLFDYCFSNFKISNVSQNENRFESTNQTSELTLFGEAEPFAVLDTAAEVVLPVSANFSDTQTTVSYDSASDKVAGTLIYSYGDHPVGTADVILTGAEVPAYEFGEKEVSAEAMEDDNDADGTTLFQKSGKSMIEQITDLIPEEVQPYIENFKGLPLKEKLMQLAILAAFAVIFIIIIVLIINRIRRVILRRRRRLDRRYKIIKSSQGRRGRKRRR